MPLGKLQCGHSDQAHRGSN